MRARFWRGWMTVSPPPLHPCAQAGSAGRWLYEAVASLRLDGSYVSAHDLVLRLNNTLNRVPDQDLGRAKDIHDMLSTLIRQNPRHLFKAQRVLALTRLRLQSRVVDHPDLPDWLQNRIHTPEEMSEALEDALPPSVVSTWESLPPVNAAAEIIANWHKSRAAERIGAAAGRALAMAWLYRAGLTSSYCLLAVDRVSGGGVRVSAGLCCFMAGEILESMQPSCGVGLQTPHPFDAGAPPSA
jgi:hypothetical protein